VWDEACDDERAEVDTAGGKQTSSETTEVKRNTIRGEDEACEGERAEVDTAGVKQTTSETTEVKRNTTRSGDEACDSERVEVDTAGKTLGVDESIACTIQTSRPVHHQQWIQGGFTTKHPDPSPMIAVKVTIMHKSHKEFGRKWDRSHRDVDAAKDAYGLADTGCQTCTAGLDFMERMRCPYEYLIPTKHRIVGITNSGLGIIGALLLKIQAGGMITRQMVYVSSKVKGLYLSEKALKELQLIDSDFPTAKVASASQACTNESCQCLKRTNTPDRPMELPFPPTKDNVERLEGWLRDQFAGSAFNKCTHQPLQKMSGKDMDVKIRKDAVPFAVHTPAPVPHHWKRQVKADIDRDVRLGIIEPVPQGTCTTWCSRMVVAPKSDGSPRRTVDLQRLNRATLRETHHTPTPFNLVSTIPPGKIKTILDAWNGYHSLPLSPKAKHATTFITEWGRYRYCRAPMGFHASGDAYTRRFDDITVDQVRKRRCVDDSILWDDNVESAFWHTFDYIKCCADNGIVFNDDKFVFAQEEVDFAGFRITMDGYKPTKKLLEAIEDFPTPKSITDIRSWFGLINQVAYSFSRTKTMAPFREMLSGKGKVFYWDGTLDIIFAASKTEILRMVEEGVRTFEINRPTCLSTDWAKTGVGFTLMQKHCNCVWEKGTPECGDGHWRLVFAGSRFTNLAESRYAPIEGEALAVVHGLDSCRMFVLGCPNLTVAVDHKPLLKFFDDRELDTIPNPRLFSLKEKTLMYNYKIEHIAGKVNYGADATSRHPARSQHTENEYSCNDAALSYAIQLMEEVRSVTWERVKEAAVTDEEVTELSRVVRDGFPQKRSDLAEYVRRYWPMRESLYLIGEVTFLDGRILIPSSLRREVIEGLHMAHQGVVGMTAHAKKRFFWPGINAAIRQARAQCKLCNENAPSQGREDAILPDPPEVPFQHTATDLCSIAGYDFIIFADCYSGWTEVAKLSRKMFKEVKMCFLRWFSCFGVPEVIASDGGPPFNSSAYNDFLGSWGIQKRQSSAYYPQSNGRAEVAVKTAKRILMGNIDAATGGIDTEKVTQALLTYRNTPLQEIGLSPAVILFGRPIRDHLPNSTRRLRKEWDKIAESREAALSKKHLRSHPEEPRRQLKELQLGEAVQVQNQHGNRPTKWSNTGTVVETLPHRQYHVMMDGSRRISLRNRRFLRQIDPVCRRRTVFNNPPTAEGHSENGQEEPTDITDGQPAELPTQLSVEHQDSRPPPHIERLGEKSREEAEPERTIKKGSITFPHGEANVLGDRRGGCHHARRGRRMTSSKAIEKKGACRVINILHVDPPSWDMIYGPV
jgi:hypothetical protein